MTRVYFINRVFCVCSSLLLLSATCFAQSNIALVDKAAERLQRGDTAYTISLLEEFVSERPRDYLVRQTNQCLASLYLGLGERDSARAKLIYALSYVPVDAGYRVVTGGNSILKHYKSETAQADICVLLAGVYDAEREWDQGLYFLNLADSMFLPTYGGCANGMIEYKAYLSLKYADHYLMAGDTASAEKRLFQYFLSLDATPKVALKLRTILLWKYSDARIGKEIDKGLLTIKQRVVKDSNSVTRWNYFSLFGKEVWRRSRQTKKESRDLLKKNPGLIVLRTGKEPEPAKELEPGY